MPESTSLYAAIDLGSNSFHMLIVREVAGSIQTLARIKRKVRLAAGLDENNHLSLEAMQRGWQCLSLFAERLQDIPRDHIRVVATATLRIATNADIFLQKAQQVLGSPIQVISGKEEARLIYHGVAHTTGGPEARLVVDIGGGSTELVTGHATQTTALFSLSMGCVTWLERYFTDRSLTQQNFERAELAAHAIISPLVNELRQHPWQTCVGASGTVQALQEIMVVQGMDEHITLDKLQQLKQQAIQCGKLEELEIEGLTLERALVFPSGLSILIAIFEALNIEKMELAGGALREGLVYGMLNLPIEQDIRRRTILNLQRRYLVDKAQAERVNHVAQALFQQVSVSWNLDEQASELLHFACSLHEIGLSIDFKQSAQHAAYLIQHTDLPGFTPAQKKLLAVLLLNQTQTVDLPSLGQQNALPMRVVHSLCRLLRLAIIFASRRRDDTLPDITLETHFEQLTLSLPKNWLEQYPLRAELLLQESRWQGYAHWPLTLIESDHV